MANRNRLVLSMALLLTLRGMDAMAQRHEILSDNIASLQVVAGDDWLSPPVVKLNGSAPINISFDDLTHEYHRYAYRLEHCEADWSVSKELFASNFCEGFNEDVIIDDVEESINTNTLYTHYKFQIPNENCKIKMSGNYKLTIYDENTGDDVACACFMVVDQKVTVKLAVTSNTDIDTNKSHQQVSMDVSLSGIKVNRFDDEIKTVVMQNGRWDNAVMNAKPQYVTSDMASWNHNKNLIFNAGNEYRKFETLDVTHTTMGLESVDWDGNDYIANVWTDEPRFNYVYDEDTNGAFYIRNSDNSENDVTTEYVVVNFKLKTNRQNDDIFINGNWTNDRFIDKYKMVYDPSNNLYTASLKLKQGYYSYQYLTHDATGMAHPLVSEGNFFQTENDYQALVYYKGTGQRTYQLVGYQQVTLK
jgi:hypothetical protein